MRPFLDSQKLSVTTVQYRAFMNYSCNWYAPTLPDPDSTTNISTFQTITFTAGGVQGLGHEPLFNGVNVPDRNIHLSLISFYS